MKSKLIVLLFTAFLAATGSACAQDDTNELAQIAKLTRLAKNLKYQQGEIELRGGLAKLSVPKEFNYLGRMTRRRCS